jgi:serine/threonine-protein kinase
MSTVYLAENPRLGNVIALKILAPELAANDVFRTRFLEESRIAAAMNHPHVIPIHDMGSSGGLLYIAMRAVSGTDLRQMIKKRGRLQPDIAIFLLSQAARALDAAHRRGLVHRDVKPGNLLVERGSDDGEPDHLYLADFGITKLAGGRSGLTNTGQFIGTIDYVAPEQIRGVSVLGMADQYSLGCVLYECLTGRVPFEKDLDAAIIWAHVEEFPTLPTVIRPDLPAAVDEVFARVLAKDPGDRYESCKEFMAAARDALGPMADMPGTGSGVRPAQVEPVPVGYPEYPEVSHDLADPVRDPTVGMLSMVAPTREAWELPQAAPPQQTDEELPSGQPAGSEWAGGQFAGGQLGSGQLAGGQFADGQPGGGQFAGAQPGLPGPGEVRYVGGWQNSGDGPYAPGGMPPAGVTPHWSPPGGSGGLAGGGQSGQRRRWLFIVAALALVAAGVGGAWAALNSGGPAHPSAAGSSPPTGAISSASAMPTTDTMSPSATAPGSAGTGSQLMQAVVSVANYTKHLNVSSCKQAQSFEVTCSKPDPSLGIGPVTFLVFPSRSALYAAYQEDAKKLEPGWRENFLGGCDGNPSVVGEASWSHEREFFTSYTIAQMTAGNAGPVSGRVFCTNSNGVETFVWTQNQGNMLAYVSAFNHTALWTWWVDIHHYIGIGAPPDMGGMVMPSGSASGSAMPSGSGMPSGSAMPSPTMRSGTAMPSHTP